MTHFRKRGFKRSSYLKLGHSSLKVGNGLRTLKRSPGALFRVTALLGWSPFSSRRVCSALANWVFNSLGSKWRKKLTSKSNKPYSESFGEVMWK